MTSRSLPPLPRVIEAAPDHATIRSRLAARDRLLWRGGQATVPVLSLRPAIATALAAAYRAGHLVLGLERVAKVLDAETRGLALMARRDGVPPRARISRLLLLSDDGAERLYRHAEGLMAAHTPRLLVTILAADAAAVGRATTGRTAAVKAILAQHKEAVAALLRALARDDERRSTMGKPGYFNDEDEDDDKKEKKPAGEPTEDDDAGEDPE